MSISVAEMPARTSVPPDAQPRLENGDRLTREEFERRYDAMTGLKKAELVEGTVYMPSPVRTDQHGEPHVHLAGWLSVYCTRAPGVHASDNGSIRLDADNMPQPDIQLFLDPACGGQAGLGEDGYVEGAPELIIEVTASTGSYDLFDKMNAYRRNRVQEYIVWRVRDREMDWFRLREGWYHRLEPGDDGIFRSEVFPGLWLDADALIRGNLARVHAVLNEGQASAEHKTFAENNSACLASGPTW
jgi:Uma2 family endonuclease